MPFCEVNGARIYYEMAGEGAETIVFAHGLFFDNRMWERQMEEFSARYRCIAFDFRGQGKSQVTSGGYDMDTLARDAIGLIEELGEGPVHFVGLSMGAYVGLRIAARKPSLIRSLVLIGASAEPESMLNYPRYYGLVAASLTIGLLVLIPAVFPVLFSEPFLQDPKKRALRREIVRIFRANRRWGISMAAYGVLSRLSIADELGAINAPTLLLTGELDAATPPSKSVSLARRIKRAELVTLPQAGHMLPYEVPEQVNHEIGQFFIRQKERLAEEMARKVALGLAEAPEASEVAPIETVNSAPEAAAGDATHAAYADQSAPAGQLAAPTEESAPKAPTEAQTQA